MIQPCNVPRFYSRRSQRIGLMWASLDLRLGVRLSPLKTVVLHPAAARDPGVTLPPAAKISSTVEPQRESNGSEVAVVVAEMAVDALAMNSVGGDDASALWVVAAAEKREGSRQSASSCPAAVLHSLSSCFLSFLKKTSEERRSLQSLAAHAQHS